MRKIAPFLTQVQGLSAMRWESQPAPQPRQLPCAMLQHELTPPTLWQRVEGSGRDAPSYKKTKFYFLLRRPESLGAPAPSARASSAQIGNVCFFPEPKLLKNQMTLALGLNLLQAEW